MEGGFSAVKNSIMAQSASCPHNLPIFTGTEPELWIAVGSRICILEGRYNMPEWNNSSPFFIIVI
jgi:hypothetical protein